MLGYLGKCRTVMEATVENKQTLSLLWRRPETKVVQEARFTFYAFFLIVPLLSPETLWNTVLNISFSQAFALLWFCDYSDVCLKSSFLFPQVQPSESCALMMNWIAKSLLFWSGEKVMSHLSGPENIYPVYIWTIVYSWSTTSHRSWSKCNLIAILHSSLKLIKDREELISPDLY